MCYCTVETKNIHFEKQNSLVCLWDIYYWNKVTVHHLKLCYFLMKKDNTMICGVLLNHCLTVNMIISKSVCLDTRLRDTSLKRCGVKSQFTNSVSCVSIIGVDASLTTTTHVCVANKLVLNECKTELLHFTSKFSTVSHSPAITIGDPAIHPANYARNLGIVMDASLNMTRTPCANLPCFGLEKLDRFESIWMRVLQSSWCMHLFHHG